MNKKAFIKDIIMQSVSVLLALVGLLFFEFAPMSELGWYLMGENWKIILLSTFSTVPLGMVFMGTLESQKDSLTAFCIVGIIYTVSGNFPLLLLALLAVFVSGFFRFLKQYSRVVEALAVGLVLAAFTCLTLYVTGRTYPGILCNLGTFCCSFAVIFLFSYLCETLVEKGVIAVEDFDHEIHIRKNYRHHSVNRKLMVMLNLFCMIMILAFAWFTYELVDSQAKADSDRNDIAMQSVLANELVPFEQQIQNVEEEGLAELGQVLADKLKGVSLRMPAKVILAARPSEEENFVEVGYFDIERIENLRPVYQLTFQPEQKDIATLHLYSYVPDAENLALQMVTAVTYKGVDKELLAKIAGGLIVIWIAINIIAQDLIYRAVVHPVNTLTSVALRFKYNSKEEVVASKKALEALKIHSGDEVESLYTTLSGTMGSMADYIDEVKESVRKLTDMQHNVIVTMADIIESRDKNTGGHIKRTAVYVRLIADKLKEKGQFSNILTEDYIENMSVAAPLHDMGKIHVPDSILNKKGRLTEEEFTIMKTHTGAGKELLEHASEQIGSFDYLEIALQMADSHHEWWNGNGYPNHLVGDEIPLCARIMAVADVFDALVSKRCYKDGMPLEKALSIIKEETGTHFDPVISEAFFDCIEDVKKVLEEQN